MRHASVQVYARVISEVIRSTSDNGADLNDDFDKLRKAINLKQVGEITTAELKRIQDHFQAGTDKYKVDLTKLNKVEVPVRILGRHKTLVADYEKYVAACQAMCDSIQSDQQTIDVDKFNQAEQDQETSIDKFSKAANRIMTGLM